MRLVSAIGILAIASTVGACRSYPSRPLLHEDLTAKLNKLGVEGKTYANDLGQVASIHVHRVHTIDRDLLIEDVHGHLTYIDGATMNPRWDYYGLGRTFDEKPDHTSTAIVGLAGGKLFVLSRANGTTDPDPSRVDVIPSSAPVANESTIYVPTYPTPGGNKTVYAISLATGYQGWGWRTDSDIVADLAKGGAGGGDTFYFVTADGFLYGFPTFQATERSPEPAWTAAMASGVSKDLVVEGDDLAVVTEDGRLVLVDRITGNIRWEAYPAAGEHATSAGQFSSRHAFYVVNGELRAFARDTGMPVWKVRGATRFVAERGGRMLLMAGPDTLLSVDTATGEVLGNARVAGWYLPTRVARDATVIAVSNRGEIVSVELGL